jgi:leader peptidase (prepilin peptidase)/N-methyltransferase
LLVAVTAIAAAIGFLNTLGPRWVILAYFGFLVLTLALGITDVDSLRIVDRLNIRGTVLVVGALGLASLGDGSESAFLRGILGGAVYFIGTNLLYLVVRGRGFGYGDVKLAVQLGVFAGFLSWGTLGWSVFLTALIGGVLSVGVVVLGVLKRNRQRGEVRGGSSSAIRDAMRAELPYGPSMILGAWIAIVLAGLGAFPIPT